MNVIDMHLAIQQGVDKINSLQADMLLSEEIDLEINKSITRFIAQKYNVGNKYQKGFEESQKRIDDLRTLVTEYENPTTFKEQYSENFWVDNFRLLIYHIHIIWRKNKSIYINPRIRITSQHFFKRY